MINKDISFIYFHHIITRKNRGIQLTLMEIPVDFITVNVI